MSLCHLPSSTVKLVSSSQVITSVSSVVKELMENSIDAGATSIEVKLENHGLAKIEVKDNGKGVSKEDVFLMCKKNYTSKIREFVDLYNLCSYGFRGEALSSLCTVSKVTVTTVTEADSHAMTYEFSHDGEVIGSKISHHNKGTTITVENLFKNLPVRKQYLTSGKRRGEEIKKVEQVVKCLGMIQPGLRVALSHNKFSIWNKSSVATLRESLVQVVPPVVVKHLQQLSFSNDKVSFDVLVPDRLGNVISTCFGHPGEALFLFINLRPVLDKDITKVAVEEICQYFGSVMPAGRYPTCLLSISLPPDGLDVNLEPNKTRVIIKHKDEVIQLLKNELFSYYMGNSDPPQSSLESDIASKEAGSEFVEVTTPGKRKIEGNDENIIENEIAKIKIARLYKENSENFKAVGNEATITDNVKENLMNDECEVNILRDIEEKSLCDVDRETLKDNSCSDEKERNLSAFFEGIFADCSESNVEESDSEKEAVVEVGKEAEEGDGSLPEEVSLSQWSRGHMAVNGLTLTSSTMIMSGGGADMGAPSSCDAEAERGRAEVATATESVEEAGSSQSQAEERSVSSQMGCKQMAGFTRYAAQMRTQMLENCPGMSFTKVASVVASKWKELQEDEREMYNEKAKSKVRSKEDRSKRLMRERLEQFLTKSREKRVLKRRGYWKTEMLEVGLTELEGAMRRRYLNVEDSEDSVHFLRELSEDLRTVRIGREFYLFSCRRLAESLLFFNNLSRMSLPITPLEEPLRITQEHLDGKLWSVLRSLETATEVGGGRGTLVVTDPRISFNGLRVLLAQQTGEGHYLLGGAWPEVAATGLAFLRELLALVASRPLDPHLVDCRPLRVVSYIRDETLKMISRNDFLLDPDKIEDDFKFWNVNIKNKIRRCPHHKSVYKKLDIDKLETDSLL